MVIDVELIPARQRQDIGSIWRALEARAGAGLAASWVWTETWLRHYGDSVPHRFALCTRRGSPCAVVLITTSSRRRGWLPRIRTLHLGTAGEPAGGVYVEWNRLVVLPELRAEVADALLRRLRRDRGWDEARLDGFDPVHAQPFLDVTSNAVIRRDASAYADLAAARARGIDILETLGQGTQRRLRQSLRAFGALESEWATDTASATAIFDELARLHAERWRRDGQVGAFRAPIFAAFHRDLVQRLVPSGEAFLFRVAAAGQTVGCLYSFIEGRRVLFYQSGLASFDDNRRRAGLVTHLLCMRACAARDLDEYDFLVGDARYKDELSTGAREQVWVTIRRRRLRLAMLAAGRNLRSARR